MGVRGLQTFMERFCPPECFRRVSIEQLVEEHRQETGEEHPIIIFDGSSCLPWLYGDLDWVAGGQFKEFLEVLKKVVAQFKGLRVRLVFFFEGTKPEWEKHVEWEHKSAQKVDGIDRLFDALAAGTLVRDLDPNLSRHPPINLGFSHYFKDLFDCEVCIAANYEAEIVDYAKKNKCLAIFGQDTDFIIYGGAKYNLSAKHFDIETMTTCNYDRNHLAKHLGLEISQLPVLATLGGNGYADFQDLRRFHRSLCRDENKSWFKGVFPALGRYIQKLPMGEALLDVLPDIAKEVLGDRKKADVLRNSILSYFPAPVTSEPAISGYPEWDEICRKAEELHVENLNTAAMLNILLGRPYRCTLITEDLRRASSLPSSGQLLRPLRQRLYGILLKEKPPEVVPRLLFPEYSREKADSLSELYRVKPMLPSDQHPGLLALWGNNRSEEMQNIRWQLFAHAISPCLSYENLKNLPEHLVLPTPTLFYLVEHKVLEPWEIEALIATVVTLPSESVERLAELSSDPVDVRAVQIAAIFMRSLQTVVKLLNACGFPLPRSKVFQHAYFDGKLFQEKYRRAKNGATCADLCENQVSALETYQKMKHILFDIFIYFPSCFSFFLNDNMLL